jgi:hypothetical protein
MVGTNAGMNGYPGFREGGSYGPNVAQMLGHQASEYLRGQDNGSGSHAIILPPEPSGGGSEIQPVGDFSDRKGDYFTGPDQQVLVTR